MQAMWRWRQRVIHQVYPKQACILCGGAEEDATYMWSVHERSLEVAEAMCAQVEEFTGDVHLANRAIQFMS